MMWQDFVFMFGSGLSVVFLAPTLRNAGARVPLGTSLPSMGIGFVYTATFLTLGMTFSAAGSFAAGSMWTMIALIRSPTSQRIARATGLDLFARDAQHWFQRRRTGRPIADQYASVDSTADTGQ